MTKIFVAGAAGQQGGATTRALLAKGHTVHAYVRDTATSKAQALKDAGAHLFAGDFDNVAALRKAMAGIGAIFFPSMISLTEADAEVRWARNIIDAALAVGTVEHVVCSTVAGTESWQDRPGWDRNPFMINYWRSKALGEEMVRAAGFKYYTILKPQEFYENFIAPTATFQLPELIKDGVWRTAWKDNDRVSLIGTQDIGRAAAAVISDPQKYTGKALELTADTLVLSDIVSLLSEKSGKRLRLQPYETEEAVELAKVDVLVHLQLTRLTGAEQSEDFGFRFQTFKAFLTENQDAVVDTYKAAP